MSLKGFLYYCSPTTDSLLFISRRISLLLKSDRGFFTMPLSKGILYYANQTKNYSPFLSQHMSGIIPVRQQIIHGSSLKGLLYDSNPTKDSSLLLSRRISLLFQSDKGLFTIPLSNDSFIFEETNDTQTQHNPSLRKRTNNGPVVYSFLKSIM